jgi:hypothetical protein
MSRGTRVVPVRLPEDLMVMVQITIELRNQNSPEAPWTLSDFIRIALSEKIRKMARSRGRDLQPAREGCSDPEVLERVAFFKKLHPRLVPEG